MIFPPFPESGFWKLSDLQSGIDSYYTADQLKKYGLKCVEEYKRCQSKQEWDIRGDLASSLKCWHRLTGAEAAELVEFTRDRLEGVQQVQEPLSLEQIDAYDSGYARGMEQSKAFREETRAYKDAYFKLVEQIANLKAFEPTPPIILSQPVREPLPDAWIRERTKQPWVFETVKTWVREIEREHGIGVSK